MILRLAYRVIRLYCLHCKRPIWPWQGRCGGYHRLCKHYLDGESANRYDMARWRCARCGA